LFSRFLIGTAGDANSVKLSQIPQGSIEHAS
jgi:hypothetical protein